LTIKCLNSSLKEEKSSNPMNFVLTLEKNLNDDSLFLLQNKELDSFYQKTLFVFADIFFALYHLKTGFFKKKYINIVLFCLKKDFLLERFWTQINVNYS